MLTNLVANGLLGVIYIFLSWALLIACLIGWGIFSARAIRILPRGAVCDGWDYLLRFWMGYAITLILLQVTHLWSPINSYVLIAWLLFGLLNIVPSVKPIYKLCVQWVFDHRKLSLLTLLALAWLANRATGPPQAHDSGLYHYPIINWANEFAAVPGLANLGVAFAINSGQLLFAALIDNWFWNGACGHLANSLLVAALLIQAARGAGRLWEIQTANSFLPTYDAMMVLPAVMLICSKEISSPKTDAAPAIVTLVLVRILLQLYELQKKQKTTQQAYIPICVLLAASLVCLKLSAVIFSIAALGSMAWLLYIARVENQINWRVVSAVLFITAISSAGWMARNSVQTGYPLYPSTAISIDVDWQTPKQSVDELVDAIKSHPKSTVPDYTFSKVSGFLGNPPWLQKFAPKIAERTDVNGLNWLSGWAITSPVHSLLEFWLPMAVLAFSIILLIRGRGAPGFSLSFMLVVLPAFLAVIYWLITAPDPRYIFGQTWAAAAAFIAVSISPSFVSNARGNRTALMTGLVATSGFMLLFRIGMLSAQGAPLLKHLPLEQPGDQLGLHPVPTVDVEPWSSVWGTKIFRPLENETLIWNTPIPAVGWPDPDPGLRQRDENDLSRGYRIETAID